MAALPGATAAAELFGHARGAFTGAVDAQDGYFVAADGGTLFLDEIGLCPPDVQAMLLRVLETKEVQPLGSRKRRSVDVRFLAATDVNLDSEVAAGKFSQALLHRIAGYQIRVPALSERRDDIGRLFVHFVREELAAVGDADRLQVPAGDQRPWLPAALVARLALCPWPGNVRQLRNVARQLVIGSRGQARARVDATIARLLDGAATETVPVRDEKSVSRPARTRPPSLIPDDELLAALRRNGWRPSATAAELGISRTSLYVLIDRSPSIRKAADVSDKELRRVQAECAGDVDDMARRLEVSMRGLQLRLRQVGRGRAD